MPKRLIRWLRHKWRVRKIKRLVEDMVWRFMQERLSAEAAAESVCDLINAAAAGMDKPMLVNLARARVIERRQ